MKKILSTLLAAGVIMTTVASAHAGEVLDRVMSKKTMVVATNASWPPQSYLDDSNNLVGYDIDVSKEIAKRLGVQVKFETPDFATISGGR